jgi:hypothetical protein
VSMVHVHRVQGERERHEGECGCVIGGVTIAVARVADVWAILDLLPRTGDDAVSARAHTIEGEGEMEGDGVQTVVTGVPVKQSRAQASPATCLLGA